MVKVEEMKWNSFSYASYEVACLIFEAKFTLSDVARQLSFTRDISIG